MKNPTMNDSMPTSHRRWPDLHCRSAAFLLPTLAVIGWLSSCSDPMEPPQILSVMQDVEVRLGDTARWLLSEHFSDPDGDELTYSATSSEEGVALPWVSGDNLAVVGMDAGEAVVTVTAIDPDGLTATQSVVVVFDDLVFRDEFESSESLADWELAEQDLEAEVSDGTLRLTAAHPIIRFEGIHRRAAAGEWEVAASLGMATHDGWLRVLVTVAGPAYYNAYVLELGEKEEGGSNYRFGYWFQGVMASNRDWIGRSDAIKGVGELMEVRLRRLGDTLRVTVGSQELLDVPLSPGYDVRDISGVTFQVGRKRGDTAQVMVVDWIEVRGLLPVDNGVAQGSSDAYWRESVSGHELMTPYLDADGGYAAAESGHHRARGRQINPSPQTKASPTEG